MHYAGLRRWNALKKKVLSYLPSAQEISQDKLTVSQTRKWISPSADNSSLSNTETGRGGHHCLNQQPHTSSPNLPYLSLNNNFLLHHHRRAAFDNKKQKVYLRFAAARRVVAAIFSSPFTSHSLVGRIDQKYLYTFIAMCLYQPPPLLSLKILVWSGRRTRIRTRIPSSHSR